MRPPRIVNRGRIAPSSPKQIIDSGRNSWSTASIVSTIETKSPEPRITEEQVNQKLQLLSKSSLKKKVIIAVSATTISLLALGIVLGTTLPNVLNKTPSETTTVTSIPQTTAPTTSLTSVPTTTLPSTNLVITTPTTASTTTTTTVK